jgi:sortase A
MLRRRLSGIALFIAGGLLVSFAGARYALGAVAQDDARRQWEENEAHAALSAARATVNRDRGQAVVADGAPVARLIIPKIGLDEIVLEGVNDDDLNGGPGHYPGSPLPGQVGNAIISAHRDRHFKNLGELGVGDTLHTQSGSRIVSWVVVSRRVIGRDAAKLFPSKDSRLTLTTCWPIRYLGSAPDRLILTAKPLGGTKG